MVGRKENTRVGHTRVSRGLLRTKPSFTAKRNYSRESIALINYRSLSAAVNFCTINGTFHHFRGKRSFISVVETAFAGVVHIISRVVGDEALDFWKILRISLTSMRGERKVESRRTQIYISR